MNTNVRPNIDANRLANLRRDILKNKRLSDAELETIKSQIREKNEPTLSPPNLDAIQEGNNETEGEARVHESDAQKESTDDVNVRVDISQECLQVDEMKQKILDKWYEIKETDLKDRNSLPKIHLNKKGKELIRISNKAILMIKESREKSLDINEVNELIYATAYVTTESIGKKITKRQQRKRKQPFWKVKIEKEIKELRTDLSILTELTKDNGMTERKRRKIRRNYSVKNENDIDIVKEKSSIKIDEATSIQEIDQEGTYKYLGINEGDEIQHSVMKEKIRKEYCRRVKLVLKSELNAGNKITAINTLAVPVLTYSFNVVNWTLQEIRKLDRKTRKILTMYRMNHPKADFDRIYISRKEGGRGLIQLECTFKTTTIGLDTYLRGKNEKLLRQLY